MLVASSQLVACDCVGNSVEEDFAIHTNVFKSRVISIEDGKGYGKIVTVEIITNYKGELSRKVKIRTGNGGPDCGFQFKEGEEYLIFASLGTMYASGKGKLLETTYCSHTGLFSKRENEVKTVKGLMNADH